MRPSGTRTFKSLLVHPATEKRHYGSTFTPSRPAQADAEVQDELFYMSHRIRSQHALKEAQLAASKESVDQLKARAFLRHEQFKAALHEDGLGGPGGHRLLEAVAFTADMYERGDSETSMKPPDTKKECEDRIMGVCEEIDQHF